MQTANKLEKGKKYNLLIKPTKFNGWYFIRETKNCFIMSKKQDLMFGSYIPKKSIKKIIEV